MKKLIAEPIFIFLSFLALLWIDGYSAELNPQVNKHSILLVLKVSNSH
jgi:hypothetical protein|tara:strand:- start:591 stop:734 length:144 start_codon:yes stop_codon:yes gene_type:complete